MALALIGISTETTLPLELFRFGVVLAVTSIPLMFLYNTHKRQAGWVIPLARRILPLMGVCAIAFGALMGWAVFLRRIRSTTQAAAHRADSSHINPERRNLPSFGPRQ